MNFASIRRLCRGALLPAAVLAALFAGARGGAAQGPPNGGGRRGPPPQSYDACSGQGEDASCSFATPNGEETGTCAEMNDGRTACIPSWAPRPPRRLAPRAAMPAPAPAPEPVPAPLPRPEPPPVAPTPLTFTVPVSAPDPVPAPAPALAAAPAAAPSAPAEPPAGVPFAAGFGAAIIAAGVLFAFFKFRSDPAETAPPARGAHVDFSKVPAFVDPGAVANAPPAPVPPAHSGDTQAPVGPNGGKLVGKNYETRRELGTGGMGVVYEAVDLSLDRLVALKKMRPEIGRSARGRDRFIEEAKLVAKLSHPNVVGIHGIIEEAGDLYLVFEYVDGVTLDDVLSRRKRLTPAEAMRILTDVSEAVDYAHSQRVIHRDLKPSNIMIDKNGRAKVMDFGIAHQAKITVSQLTMVEAFGTMAYMPPEQELGKAVRESDVYAFAAVTYETLTGGLPFPGPNFHLQKMEMAFQPPSEAAALPAAFDEVFTRALQAEPKKRYPTSGEFVRTLRGAMGR